MAYVVVIVGHPSFTTGQWCLVKVNQEFTFIKHYAEAAFERACADLKLPKSECALLDYQFIGDEIHLVL